MRALDLGLAIVLVTAPLPRAALASADIRVDLSSQTMRVLSDSGEHHLWPVSTARRGFSTPRGTYRVQRLDAMHFSSKYQNAPMPHSIFFHGGYAIHGSYETASLGRTASHGCIRLSPANAAVLYNMVASEGARITITGSAPQTSETRRLRSGRRAPELPEEAIDPGGQVPYEPGYDGWSSGSGEESFQSY